MLWLSSCRSSAVPSTCWSSRVRRKDPGSISGATASQSQRPPRAGRKPSRNNLSPKESHLPKPQSAAPAHTWMVCPQFLHNQCECSQAIVQELSSDLSEGEHTQSAPKPGFLAANRYLDYRVEGKEEKMDNEGKLSPCNCCHLFPSPAQLWNAPVLCCKCYRLEWWLFSLKPGRVVRDKIITQSLSTNIFYLST